MIKRIFLAFLLLSVLASAQIPEKAYEQAKRYTGYEEIPGGISVVSYRGSEYYKADYTKTLTYSGSLVMDVNCEPVRDREVLDAFAAAALLSQQQNADYSGMYSETAAYYSGVSGYLSQTGYKNLSDDARDISNALSSAANHLRAGTSSFSPEDAQGYLDSEEEALSLMQETYWNAEKTGDDKLKDYMESVSQTYLSMTENRKAMLEGVEMYETMLSSRVEVEETAQKEMILAGLAVAFFVLLFVLRIRR